MNPVDIILWSLAAVGVALAVAIIMVIAMVIAAAVRAQKKPSETHVVIHNPATGGKNDVR